MLPATAFCGRERLENFRRDRLKRYASVPGQFGLHTPPPSREPTHTHARARTECFMSMSAGRLARSAFLIVRVLNIRATVPRDVCAARIQGVQKLQWVCKRSGYDCRTAPRRRTRVGNTFPTFVRSVRLSFAYACLRMFRVNVNVCFGKTVRSITAVTRKERVAPKLWGEDTIFDCGDRSSYLRIDRVTPRWVSNYYTK